MRDLAETLAAGSQRLCLRRFIGFDAEGRPRVAAAPDDASGTPALSLVPLQAGQAGADVAVAWLDGDPPQPIILGLVQPAAPLAEADGARVLIEGRREVVLRCGRASITLRPDGSITIRGAQILSRADGSNRVQGASVQLN